MLLWIVLLLLLLLLLPTLLVLLSLPFMAGFVFVPQPHLGIVQNGHQHVVELVRRRAHQLAQRREFLHSDKLLFERDDLTLQSKLAGVARIVRLNHGG